MINFVIRRFYKTVVTNEIIRADLYRYFGIISYDAFCKALRIPGFEFSLYFRLSIFNSKYSILGVLSRIRYKKLTFKYGFQIPRATVIGRGLRISHFGALVINYDAVIGDHCYLSHNVTIGHATRGPRQGSPTIGNQVWIGPGAIIIGKINIGNNVLIAGNAFVNFDVPSNSIVLGNPGKIIPDNAATEGYVTNVNPD